MSVENLGEPLTGVYSIPDGQARLYERGMTVNGVIVSFAFPMIGRPSIVTGTSASASPFGPDAINFRLGDSQLGQIAPMIQLALAGRLSLVPTRQATGRVPLTIGPAVIVTPEKRPGAGGIVIPAVYGMSVTTAALQERQLYDVAVLADGGQWQIVAPHAVYHRRTWTDFGIAHITDIHVARRIDRFRELLVQAGRAGAAQRMFNFNDRFRGFVRYANYLHSIGVLDVILAIGDVIDYIFEDDDDPAGGGNNEFMRKLILGQAPGPDFPDVEELLVPIFMVPGNHDYRKHPYKLLFDVHIRIFGFDKDVTRIKNFPPYHLLQADALVLANALDGRAAGSDVENISPPNAAWMVDVDPEIKGYKTYLADRRSYVVRLGKHRIAMLDSGYDVGMVTDVIGALTALIAQQDEDKVTFLGGSPNSEGVSPEELAMVSDALSEVPDDGLFVVGVHAPLCNPWKEEYPYFLRETQRAAQPGQTQAFLARHDKAPVYANSESVEQQVERRHPLWFPGERDDRAPTFVTRRDSQDLLDFGVSRGHADTLMGLLAGIGSRRPADVVLSGHTHNHNEFSVRKTHTGELAYSMDFYTQNPFRYYPTRFTRQVAPRRQHHAERIDLGAGNRCHQRRSRPRRGPGCQPVDDPLRRLIQESDSGAAVPESAECCARSSRMVVRAPPARLADGCVWPSQGSGRFRRLQSALCEERRHRQDSLRPDREAGGEPLPARVGGCDPTRGPSAVQVRRAISAAQRTQGGGCALRDRVPGPRCH